MNSQVVVGATNSNEAPNGNVQTREDGRATTADIFRNRTLNIFHLSRFRERFKRQGDRDVVTRMDTITTG